MNRRNHGDHWLPFKLLVRFIITGQYFVGQRDRLINRPMLPSPATPRSIAPDLQYCAHCGQSLSAGYWLLDAMPYHAECVNWSQRRYPFEWALLAAQRLSQKWPDDPVLRNAWAVLGAVRKAWPNNALMGLKKAARAAAIVSQRDAMRKREENPYEKPLPRAHDPASTWDEHPHGWDIERARHLPIALWFV